MNGIHSAPIDSFRVRLRLEAFDPGGGNANRYLLGWQRYSGDVGAFIDFMQASTAMRGLLVPSGQILSLQMSRIEDETNNAEVYPTGALNRAVGVVYSVVDKPFVPTK
jgi:hypothetical protein